MLSSLHHISLRGIRMPSRHSHAFAALAQGSWILDAGNWLVCGHVVPQRFLGSLQDQKFDSGFPMRFTLISCNQKIPKTSISKVLLYSISIYIYLFIYIYIYPYHTRKFDLFHFLGGGHTTKLRDPLCAVAWAKYKYGTPKKMWCHDFICCFCCFVCLLINID